MDMRFLPAWMIDSSVYENSETIVIRSAASRVYARNPLVVSGTRVFDTCRTIQLPSRCSSLRLAERCRRACTLRLPITTSDAPLRSGATSAGMSWPKYWLSPSVFTM